MRLILLRILVVGVLAALAAPLHAGLYYSGESYADLPSQWRGFLLDHRALRMLAVPPNGSAAAGPLRKRYQVEVEKLTKLAQRRKLTADEAADLGALYLRLGETARAIEILRIAQRDNPQHFYLAAN